MGSKTENMDLKLARKKARRRWENIIVGGLLLFVLGMVVWDSVAH